LLISTLPNCIGSNSIDISLLLIAADGYFKTVMRAVAVAVWVVVVGCLIIDPARLTLATIRVTAACDSGAGGLLMLHVPAPVGTTAAVAPPLQVPLGGTRDRVVVSSPTTVTAFRFLDNALPSRSPHALCQRSPA
jgi:hypothetical protein